MINTMINNKPDQTSKLEAVLFDLDGTLLDTANDLGEALNHVLKKKGLPIIDRKIYRPEASNGAKGLLELGFGSKINEFNYESLRVEFLDYYENNLARYTRLYDGIDKLLTYLDSNDIPWGIITNKPENLTLLLLPNYQEFKHCQCIIGGDTLPKRKPDPAPLLHGAKFFGISPGKAMMLGDSISDVKASRAAGFDIVCMSYGYNHGVDILTANPDAVIDSFAELEGIF